MEKNYSFLSKAYDNLFEENIQNFCDNISKDKNRASREYCLFYPSFGSSEKKDIEFIFYGQAVKGWCPEFNPTNTNYQALLTEAKKFSNITEERMLNPLDWVNIYWSKSTKRKYDEKLLSDYDTYRSFFWNVTCKLISDYYQIDRNKPDWSSKLMWSNLPAERKNPDQKMYEAQLEGCVKLFKKELEEIQPKYAIVLTNFSWAEEFVKGLEGFDISKSEFIEATGYHKKTGVIVSKRPFSGKSDPFAAEILKLMRQP